MKIGYHLIDDYDREITTNISLGTIDPSRFYNLIFKIIPSAGKKTNCIQTLNRNGKNLDPNP